MSLKRDQEKLFSELNPPPDQTTELLAQILQALNQMNNKLDRLDKLDKLDDLKPIHIVQPQVATCEQIKNKGEEITDPAFIPTIETNEMTATGDPSTVKTKRRDLKSNVEGLKNLKTESSDAASKKEKR